MGRRVWYPLISSAGKKGRAHPAARNLQWADQDATETAVWSDWFFGGEIAVTAQVQTTTGAGVTAILPTLIYVGGSPGTDNINVGCYNAVGELQSTITYSTETLYGIATDLAGNVYVGGTNATAEKNPRKYNSSGALQWSANQGNTVNGLAVDSTGAVYGVGLLNAGVSLKKYTPDGILDWQLGTPGDSYCVAHGSGDYIAVGSVLSGGATTRRYSSSGSLSWARSNDYPVRGIDIDGSGNVYSCGDSNFGTNSTVRKYNSAGTLLWEFNSGNYEASIKATGDGGFVVASYWRLAKFDDSQTQQWIVDTDIGGIMALAVDSYGNIYAACIEPTANANNETLFCFSPDGQKLWGTEVSLTSAALPYCVAVYEPPAATALVVPGLALSLALGLPTMPMALLLPSLPFALALGLPQTAGGEALIPPEFTDHSERIFYRAYLAGGNTMLELPLRGFQCTRRPGESTWLALDVPGVSRAVVNEVRARVAIGATALVYCGTRSAAGVETVGELLRAILTATEYILEPGATTLAVTARVVTPTYTATPRILRGVQTRTTESGRRAVRCAVDPLLRPGDTVIDGSTSWVAGAMQYQIGTGAAWMDVTEDLS